MLLVRRAGVGFVVGICLTLASLSQASAATTVGQLFTPTSTCISPGILLQTGVASGNSYVIPSNGVITGWSFQDGATPVSGLKLKVARPAGGSNYAIVGESSVGIQSPNVINSFPTRIPVQSGEIIGLYQTGSGDCALSTGNLLDTFAANGSDLPPGSSPAPFSTAATDKLPIAAVVEPDADGDGFGDETQDKCPGVFGSVQGCPKADLAVTASSTASTVTSGQNVTYVLSGTNNGPDPAPNVVIADTLPSGTSLVSAAPSSGSCSGTSTVSCNVGTLASGAAATVSVILRMTSIGASTSSATVGSPTLVNAAMSASGAGDTNAANNSTSVSTTVLRPGFPGVRVRGGTLGVSHGVAVVTVSSPLAATGKLTLSAVINPATNRVISARSKPRRTVALGMATLTVGAGQHQTVRLHLSNRGLKLLHKNKRMPATVTAIATDSFGTTAKTRAKVRLKAS